MCGIAGYYSLKGSVKHNPELIQRMVGAIRHRGPDEAGAFFSDRCVLGHARLSIIDLTGGAQPLCNEDSTLWITYNGEIYNYIELRQELLGLGHKFKTDSDTEVIIHAYEQWGEGCLDKFNGQFAFVICDLRKQELFAARDRLGIRPLFFTQTADKFIFASEIKALFCHNDINRSIDLVGLDQTFTWWTTAPGRTAFEGISELPPGCYLRLREGRVDIRRYWTLSFPLEFDRSRSLESWSEELHSLLVDSVRLRLRADVPVGAYLSGGLDSSATTSLIRHFTDTPVETFSISFSDKAYDESEYQNQMAEFLGTRHHRVGCTCDNIATHFPDVIYHAERPIVRTAPTPLLMLSRLVRQNDFKVVLTGEGADEILGGYDIFKETLIRRFWARNPESKWRPTLLRRLYPTLPLSPARARFYLETFYKQGLNDVDRYFYSHQQRINTTTKIKDFFSDDTRAELSGIDSTDALSSELPSDFSKWHHLNKAQFLEATSLLSGYLLSSQGDRMASANAVEGRYPFLDHRVVEFASTIPPWYKIMGLKEKMVLKKAMRRELPREILARVKQPYMAPDSNSFFQDNPPEYISEMLSEAMLQKSGLFNPDAVKHLKNKCARLSHAHMSFKDNMSFVGILSTQLLWHRFVDNSLASRPLAREAFNVWIEQSS